MSPDAVGMTGGAAPMSPRPECPAGIAGRVCVDRAMETFKA